MNQPKKELLKKCLVANFGNVKKSCEEAGIDRKTYYNWKANDPEFKAYLDGQDFREDLKDFIEEKLVHHLTENNPTVTIFMAKTQCKDRGYVEKTEVDGTIRMPAPTIVAKVETPEEAEQWQETMNQD